jgi:repressor of nif and glnA expression
MEAESGRNELNEENNSSVIQNISLRISQNQYQLTWNLVIKGLGIGFF